MHTGEENSEQGHRVQGQSAFGEIHDLSAGGQIMLELTRRGRRKRFRFKVQFETRKWERVEVLAYDELEARHILDRWTFDEQLRRMGVR